MSHVRFFVSMALVLLAAATARAQATLPSLKQAFPARSLVAGGAYVAIDLSDYFTVSGVAGPVAQFDTIKGKLNVELLSANTPKTVENFLKYVNRGAYTKSLIHRSVASFVIQGGGYQLNGTTIDPIPTDPPVVNEFKYSNTRGTLAMAKTDAGPNTATSQWYFNLTNNSSSLDGTNGGYTVFGRVIGTGLTIVDALAAIPIYDASAQLGAAFKEMPLTANSLTTDHLVLVNSIKVIPLYPELASATSVLDFNASTTSSTVVGGEIIGSTLILKPLATGSATLTVRAADTNGNATESSFTVTVAAAPAFTTQPVSQAIAATENTNLSAAASGNPTYRWQRNGADLSATTATVNVKNMEAGLAGLYTVVATSGGVSAVSAPAILGVTTTSKVIGNAREVGADIQHPNGNFYDQLLLEGTTAALTADYVKGDVTRISFIDLNDDIVQIEYSGPGTVAVTLDEATGPAAPTKYNQPSVSYKKGHASIVVSGANEFSNLSIFTVGRATAFDPTGIYNILQPVSATNNPANNGSPLFQGHASTSYDGFAGISRISISSTNGKFGGIRAANATFYDVKGYTGIYAPGVTFVGPVYVHDISAYGTATPAILLGGAQNNTWITGGDLYQDNGQPIQVSGITQLAMKDGSDSHGNTFGAKRNQGILYRNGQNATSELIVNPQ